MEQVECKQNKMGRSPVTQTHQASNITAPPTAGLRPTAGGVPFMFFFSLETVALTSKPQALRWYFLSDALKQD